VQETGVAGVQELQKEEASLSDGCWWSENSEFRSQESEFGISGGKTFLGGMGDKALIELIFGAS
jgi:hypothetical protein